MCVRGIDICLFLLFFYCGDVPIVWYLLLFIVLTYLTKINTVLGFIIRSMVFSTDEAHIDAPSLKRVVFDLSGITYRRPCLKYPATLRTVK